MTYIAWKRLKRKHRLKKYAEMVERESTNAKSEEALKNKKDDPYHDLARMYDL